MHDSFLSEKARELLPRRMIGLERHQAKRNPNQYIYCYVLVLSCVLDTTDVTKLELNSSPGA